MLTYDLKTGYSCNNHCVHCVIEDSRDNLIIHNNSIDLSTEECFFQIDQAIKLGAKYIVLTGGEVTIRKDFSSLVNYCAQQNLDITIQTNGRRLYVPEIARATLLIKQIRFVIALHGVCSQTHDRITRVVGSFNETCEGIKYCLQHNKLIILKVVISKYNINELSKIVALASNLGVRFICFAFPHGQGGARKRFNEVIPKYTDLNFQLQEIIKNAKIFNIQIEFEDIPFCIIPHNMHLVGELKYRFGNTICSQVGDEIFDWSEVRKSIKKKSYQCLNCSMNSICEGVWSEYIDTYGGNEFIPISIPDYMKDKLMQALDRRYGHQAK